MKKSKSEIAAYGVALFLAMGMAASCGSAVTKGAQSERGTTVSEVTLSNGVVCAVMDTTKGPAIDCLF